VVSFREKPNPELAETFVRQGNFKWNAGMFIWTVPAIMSAFTRHAPALSGFIGLYHSADDPGRLLRESFPQLPKISFDYAIMEKAGRVLMVEAAFDWDDVGGWLAVAKYLQADSAGNAGNTPLQTVDSSGNIVFSDTPTMVGLLGVRDLIVVRTGDALLVCHRAEAEQIKRLVAGLPAELQ
jgi:mannose-1-phosphate guanylyltransferase